MIRRSTIFCFLGLLLTCQVFSQGRQTAAAFYADKITAERLREHLSVLASDSLEGRGTAGAGMVKAANYVASVFATSGLPPAVNGSYYQPVPLLDLSKAITTLSIAGKTYVQGKDYLAIDIPPLSNIQETEIFFAGYGIQDSASGWNDYHDADVAGKVVLIIDGEPIDKKGNSRITKTAEKGEWGKNRDLKLDLAIAKKAKAVICVHNDFEKVLERRQRHMKLGSYELYDKKTEERTPVIYVGNQTANAILATISKDVESFRKNTSSKKKHKVLKIQSQFTFTGKVGMAQCNNVLGYVEGTDKKDELVIISAHLDHLGVIDDKIYHGADDDGSGSASILTISEAFAAAKREGQGPRRSILFIEFTGEEKGLLGSKYYTDNPVFPLSKTIADLNIDMIGRRDTIARPDTIYTYIIGSDKLSTDLHTINETANSSCCELLLDYRYNDPNDKLRLYYRSDHYNFAKKNIPVIFYFTGLHADYHKPTDTIDKIEFNRMVPIARLVFHTAWELANREDAIRVNVKTEKP